MLSGKNSLLFWHVPFTAARILHADDSQRYKKIRLGLLSSPLAVGNKRESSRICS